jgi:hypothetical protein
VEHHGIVPWMATEQPNYALNPHSDSHIPMRSAATRCSKVAGFASDAELLIP